jgi:hypothetical protein
MNSSSDRFPWETSDSPLGPAVPGADAAESGASPADDALPEPLAPFLGGGAAPAETPRKTADAASAPDTAADEPLDESDEDLGEIPWLLSDEIANGDDQPESEPVFAAEAPPAPAEQPAAAADDESPFGMVDLEPFEAAPTDPGETGTPESEALPPFPAISSEPEQWPVESAGADLPEPDREPFAPPADSVVAGAGDIPDRLERIARALRTGTPMELLSNATDPLEVLIVGYALGASQNAGRRGS